MTEIDYDKLNEAAQAIWDTARAKGHQEGYAEAAHNNVEWTGRKLLGIAANLLGMACALDGPHERRRAAQIARMIYGSTPGGPGFDEGRLARKFDRVLARTDDIDTDAALDLTRTLIDIAGKREPVTA